MHAYARELPWIPRLTLAQDRAPSPLAGFFIAAGLSIPLWVALAGALWILLR